MSREPSIPSSIFDKATVILVEPKYPGNVGAVARAMKNMGFSRLSLVAPRAEIADEARRMAVGAGEILGRALRFPTLAEALHGTGLAVGTTSRSGRWQMYNRSPAEMARLLSACWASERVALVFGPEDRGLRRSELNCCQWIVTIPTAQGKHSINISHAVMILCYEIRRAVGAAKGEEGPDAGELEQLLAHIERSLTAIGFLQPNDPRRMKLKLQDLFGRANPTDREIRSLHATLHHIDKKIGKT